MVIRLDDISPNTDPAKLDDLLSIIKNFLPDADIWLGVTFFAKFASNGAVYPELPLKDKSMDFFFNVNRFMRLADREFNGKLCSHGLWHFDHTKSMALAEASIITSCRLLESDTFIPPFNKWDYMTERFCSENGINLVKSQEDGWLSFEFNEFDPEKQLWYLHPWRWTPNMLREYFSKSMVGK